MKIRKILTLVMCGIVLGVTMSVVSAPAAEGRSYYCDQKIASMEKKAAADYAKGKLTDEEYTNVQAEIAFHRELWGC